MTGTQGKNRETLALARFSYATAAVHTMFTYNDHGKEIELYLFSCAQAEIVFCQRMHQLA